MQELLFETKNLTISFGNHVAVDHVTLQVPRGQFKSIIGPNGAGKTTFLNLLSGQLKPTSGQLIYKGREITSLPPHQRTRLGIGRSFQITNVFPHLTVLENVRLAVQSASNVRYQFIRHFRSYPEFTQKAYDYLEKVRLREKADHPATSLAHGEKRKLELAILLALETEVLLLDEPTAGMSLEEVPHIVEIIRDIKNQGEKTILLIEHKMDLILDLSDTIAVLFNGRLLADDAPHHIMDNENVQQAYLGGLYNDVS